MIINCTGFMDVNMNRMFSVSSNVSLDTGLACDDDFKNHGYFEGRDSFTQGKWCLFYAPPAVTRGEENRI